MSQSLISSSFQDPIDIALLARLEPVHYIIIDHLVTLIPFKLLRVSLNLYNRILPSIYKHIVVNQDNAFESFASLLNSTSRKREALALTEVLSLEHGDAAKMLKGYIDRGRRLKRKEYEGKLFPNAKHLHLGWEFLERIFDEAHDEWPDVDEFPLEHENEWMHVMAYSMN